MGAGLSNPIEGETEQKMKDIIESTVATFSAKYPKAYSVALLKKTIEDAKKGDADGDYELLSRPAESKNKDPIKTGWMLKEGAVVKNWKKRFFVVRYDYKIEYYDKEESYKNGGTPKGIINPAGYKVEAEADNALVKRAEALAQKLKIDISSLPKPKTLPQFTIALLKERRREWFIQFESEAQKQEWLPVFKDCCKKAEGLNTNDPVAKSAYWRAFNATRESRGYYDSWNFSGSEDQNLTDLIVRQLSSAVLDDIFASIEEKVSNPKMRTMFSEQLEKGIATTVGTAVSAGWTAASKAAEAARGPAEAKLKENADKLAEAESSVTDKATEAVSSVVDPAAAKVVGPFSDGVLGAVLSPVEHALKELISVFENKSGEAVNSITSGQDENQVWRDLARLPWQIATLGDSAEKLKDFKSLLEKTDKLGDFGEDKIEGMIGTALATLQTLLDKAIYTLQFIFSEKTAGTDKAVAATEARAETTAKLLHDCRVTAGALLQDLLGGFALPTVKKDVLEPAKEALAPIVDAIPDLLKDVLDPDEILEEVVVNVVKKALDTIITPALPSF